MTVPGERRRHLSAVTAVLLGTALGLTSCRLQVGMEPDPTAKPASLAPAARTVALPASATATPGPLPPATPVGLASSAWGRVLLPLAEGQTYTDPRRRFSLRVPAGWTRANVQGAQVAFTAPGGPTYAAVLLKTLPPGQQDVAHYSVAATRKLRDAFTRYTPISEERVVVAGRGAVRAVAQVTQAGQPVDIMRVYFVDGAVAHILAFGAAPRDFANQQIIFDAIAGSYTVLR